MSARSPLRSPLIAVSAIALVLVGGPVAIAAPAVEPADLPGWITVVSAPTLEGERTVGSTLTITGGVFEPSDVTLTYTWYFGDGCCSGGPLDDTGTTHVITPEDSYAGFVGVTVTATKLGYEPAFVDLNSGRIIADVPPAPFDSAAELTTANKGGLTATSAAGVATISIPGTGPGIQFYVYGYGQSTPLGFHVTIDPEVPEFQPAYDIEVDYSPIDDGPQKLAVLTTAGDLVGWVWVNDEPLSPPLPDSSGLTAENDGGATGRPTGTDNEVIIEVPNAVPGENVHLTGYSTPVSLGWYTVLDDGTIRVDYSALPPGEHKIAVVRADGTLLGWVAVTAVGDALAATGPLPLSQVALLGVLLTLLGGASLAGVAGARRTR
jgi:hypothetical protein